MKFGRLKNGKTKLIILIAMAIVMSLIQTAFCRSDLSVMIQKTPVNGGMVTPTVGIHNFGEAQEVILTAVPKPGYRFVYWIGDVVDPTSNRTVATIESPQIIIAVFERDEFEFAAESEHQQDWMAHPGLYFHSPYYPSGGGGGAGGRRNGGGGGGGGNGIEELEEDEFPVPIPEPATIIFTGLGSLIAIIRQKQNKEMITKR
ncbi:MAG: InlB B-repeat-containing protein [Planctomycetota bacterium]|jgi:hypothetical protein